MQEKQRKKCRPGLKRVGACCVSMSAGVTMPIRGTLIDDLSYARNYLLVLPQQIREVQEATKAVLQTAKETR